jgi:hypothetical protein
MEFSWEKTMKGVPFDNPMKTVRTPIRLAFQVSTCKRVMIKVYDKLYDSVKTALAHRAPAAPKKHPIARTYTL